jgi:hypothetical protein
MKKISYNGSGMIQREDYFEDSYCVQTFIQSYNGTVTERFYRKGEMIEEKVIKE